MKTFRLKKWSIAASLLLTMPLISFSQKDSYDLAKQMFVKTKKIKKINYTMNKKERIKGKLVSQSSEVSLLVKPYKVYIKQLSPKYGLEVLYVEGKNDNEAVVNTNGFPWFNLSLDPYGSTMRNNQHHTLFEAGYGHVVSILEYLFNKYGEDTREMVNTIESTTHDGKDCWIIKFNNPHYKHINYKVKKGETVLSIAEKFYLPEYKILEMNSNVDWYDDVSEGQVIKIPNDYSPKMTLIVEKERMIPLVMKIYDDKGLYEQYEYSNIKLNGEVKPGEFTKGYKGYNF